MPRKSRDPQSAATVNAMSPTAVAQYQRYKSGGGVVGWSSDRDPWGWVTAKAQDAWAGNSAYPQGGWPPKGKTAAW